MNSAELIAALRYCKDHEQCDNDSAAKCPYEHHWTDGEDCESLLLADAANALEAAGRWIARLEFNKLAERLRDLGYHVTGFPVTANLYEHKVPFIHPCSICGQWHTCPNAYTTDAELCKEHEDMR